jgi:hypothetical protein
MNSRLFASFLPVLPVTSYPLYFVSDAIKYNPGERLILPAELPQKFVVEIKYALTVFWLA